MKKLEAYSISIGVLGAVDTFLTATIFPVPVYSLPSNCETEANGRRPGESPGHEILSRVQGAR
jgi:hypothetical protein